MMKIGVISGLSREVECFNKIPLQTRKFYTCSGVGPERAEKAARDFIDAGATALMSFGVAGGLSEVASAGTVVLADAVINGQQVYNTDKAWHSRLFSALWDKCPLITGLVAGTDRMVPTSSEKQELFKITKALCCDMESHAMARVAASKQVPFSIIRAISDPYDRDVPSWVLRNLTPTGGVRITALSLQALRRPSSWGKLAGLSRESNRAFKNLGRVALSLGPSLQF